MANNPGHPFPIIAIIIGIIGVVVTVTAFAYVFSPPPSAPPPTQTVEQPTLISTNQYQPEVIPPLTDFSLTQRPTVTPTNTPFPSHTPFVPPTLASTSQLLQLPDLIVTGLREPVCVPESEGTILEFTFYVRNIGRVSTGLFGPFDIGVFFLLGQRRYSLEEWDEQFDGVIGTSDMEVSNLNPNDDIKFTVVIDLKGNKNFGIEVVANAGDNPIREADMSNNALIKYYSGYCY